MKKIKFECPKCKHTELELIREGNATTETVLGWDEDEMEPMLGPPELCDHGESSVRCWYCGWVFSSNADDNEELYENLKEFLVDDDEDN